MVVAYAKIDIDGFRVMISDLEAAQSTAMNLKGQLRALLGAAGTDASLGGLDYVSSWVADCLPGLHQRLVWALWTVNWDPDAHVVSFSEDYAEQFGPVVPVNGVVLSPQQLADLAARVAAGVSSRSDLSPDDWLAWQTYADNPYFAAALMGDCSPQQLADYAAWLSRGYGSTRGSMSPKWTPQLHAMQTSFSTWVNGLVDPSVAQQAIIDILQSGGGWNADLVNGSVGMSLLLDGSSFNTDMTLAISEAMYQWAQSHPAPYPGDHDPCYPDTSAPNPYVYPDGSKVNNVVAGVMSLLGNNQAAATQFFKADSTNPPDRVTWAVTTAWGGGAQAAARALIAGDALNPNLPWVKQMLPPGLAVVPPDPLIVVKLGHAFAASGSSSPATTFLELALLGTVMVNNCPEPYQHLFLEHLDELKVVDTKSLGKSMTWPLTGTIYTDVDNLLAEEPSPLWTFFHEYGHLIDQNSRTPGYDSPDFTYPDPTGTPRSLEWWLQQDLVSNLSATLGAGQQSVISYVLNLPVGVGNWLTFGLPTKGIAQAFPNSTAAVIVALQKHYQLPGVVGHPQARTVSDIYGSLTNNLVTGNYSHYTFYWWFHPPAAPPASEFWASYFADQITNSTQVISLSNPTALPLGWTPPSQSYTLPDGTVVKTKPSLQTTSDYFPQASQIAKAFAGSLP